MPRTPAKAPKGPEIKDPPAGAICGVLTEGGMCNLLLGHPPYSPTAEHARIAPGRDRMGSTAQEAPEPAPEKAPETPVEAAQRIFGPEALGARPVIAKLAKIMAEIGVINPEGENKHFNYRFIKDTQISGAIRPRMAREGLICIPDVVEESWVETKTARGGTSWVTKLKVYFTVIDSVSGDSIGGHGYGYGDDSGDKGANKAFTAAMKYWLIKLFQIGGEDDLESDQRADERAAGRESGSAQTQPNVTVTGGNITGIARGGMSDRLTAAQARQIAALYKDLELTPEKFAELVDLILGDKMALSDDESQHDADIKAFLKLMTAEDAGTLITGMVELKDHKAAGEQARAEDETSDGSDPYP